MSSDPAYASDGEYECEHIAFLARELKYIRKAVASLSKLQVLLKASGAPEEQWDLLWDAVAVNFAIQERMADDLGREKDLYKKFHAKNRTE
jgi:hypothetical protein